MISPSRSSLVFASVIAFGFLCGCGGSTGSGTSSGGGGTPPITVASTSAVLAVSPNPAPAGATILLTATVSSTAGTPTGMLTFLDGATSLGTGTLNGGVATLQVSTFSAGSSHTLSVSYAGATGYSTSTSPTVSFTENTAAAPSSITAHATFDFSKANQTIAGFGGAEAFYLSYLDSHPYASEIYTALFDPQKGLGLTFLRLQNLYYQYSGNNATFDPDTPLIVAAANAAHGTPLTLLMSSWSPPAAIKSTGNVNSGGTLATVNGGYDYADFATFWYNSLAAYATQGVVPAYISIQNEPDFTATYASCRFNPTEAPVNGASYAGYGLAFDAVYKKLQTMASPPQMVGPETFSTDSFLATAAQIPSNEVAAYAHHLYNVNSNEAVNTPDAGLTSYAALAATYPTQTKFETEYYMYPGFYNAWDIHNALTVANDNAYLYWQLAWPSTVYTAGQGADQEGLLYIDNPFAGAANFLAPHGWAYNDAYYAMKHYSYYVRPGYIRYNAAVDNTDERVSVFQSPDKKTTVIVAINTSTSVTDGLSLSLGGVSYASSTVFRSSFATPIATGERWANLGAYSSTGVSLPPESVITVVLSN
jgi:glucuronoarabinoxylan endo-1,4-beta-xylanase